jgi:hypothetical protein
MNGLTTALLGRACRIFLELAYPGGYSTIPPPKNIYFSLPDDQPLEAVLASPVCQPLLTPDGAIRGYSLRLGSAFHPHLKLQIISHDESACIFGVDTHDAIDLQSACMDAARWEQFQKINRQLKERIEQAWEAAGLLTFNGLLRRELARL